MWHKNRHFQLINDKIHNKMKKMRAAIIGYGNIGKYVLDAKLPASFAEMRLMSPMN